MHKVQEAEAKGNGLSAAVIGKEAPSAIPRLLIQNYVRPLAFSYIIIQCHHLMNLLAVVQFCPYPSHFPRKELLDRC